MNTDESNDFLTATAKQLALTPTEETEAAKMAAVGLSPRDIAVALDMDKTRRELFCLLAEIPNSAVEVLITSARAEGRVAPQIKLQEAAAAGNIEAIRTLDKVQRANQLTDLIRRMDDDEFNP